MFCHKCGSKSPEGAAFCQKCGTKLIQDGAATQATNESVNVTTTIPVKTPRSPAAKGSRAAQESSAPKSTAPTSKGAAEIYNLLKENISSCPSIKAVAQAKNGTVLKGTIRKYLIVIAASGQAVIVSSLTFPFIILDWIAYGLVCIIAANIGWEFMEYGSIRFEDFALMLAVSLLIGGLIKTITPFLGFKEKEAISTYVSKIAESKGGALAEGTAKTKVPAARLAVSIIPTLIGAIILIFVMMDNFGFGGGGDVPAATIEHSSSSIVDNVSLSKTYASETEGFTFNYPDPWGFYNGGESTILAISDTGGSTYNARMTISKYEPDDLMTVSKEEYQEHFSKLFNEYSILEFSDTSLNGISLRKVTASYFDTSDVIVGTQYIYIVNDNMYVINFSSLQSNYSTCEPIFNAIMDSYTITAANASEGSGIEYSDTVISKEDALNIAQQFIDEHPLYLRTITGAVGYEPTDTRYNYDTTGLYRIGLIADDGSDRSMWVSKDTGKVFISPDGILLLTGEEYYKTNLVGEETYAPSASAISAQDLIGEFSYDASFTDPTGMQNNFYYLLEIDWADSDLMITETWRGIYIFDHVRVSPDSLTGNTLVFTSTPEPGLAAETHSLTYIPAKDSPLGKDTIYIDNDETMPYVRE